MNLKIRNIKLRVIVTILVICSIFSFNVCMASSISNSEYIAKFLINIGVMNGYPDGSLGLENSITREEFSKLIVLASSFKDNLDLMSPSSPFVDVRGDRWSAPYVKVAAQNNILKGYPDLTFKPENNITVEEASVIALRILNYTSNDYGTSWPYSQINFAKQKDILVNINKTAGQNITRQDAINIIYNVLCSNINGQNVKYINLLDYQIIENVNIIASNKQDASIGANQILTSNGMFEVKYIIDQTTIGSKAKLIVDLDGKVVSIIPNNQNSQVYTLLSIVDNAIIVSDNGVTKNISVSSDLTVYYKSQKTTLKNVINMISENSLITVFYNNNEIDYVLIQEADYMGPYVVTNSTLTSDINISSNVTVIKNGATGSISDINIYDVIYYYKASNEVVVYDDKISGEIEDILPSVKNANSIILAGNTYKFETQKAYDSIQKFQKGDTVTAILGKDGNIVDIMEMKDIKNEQIGLLLTTGTTTLTNDKNEKYSQYYANVMLLNGTTTKFVVDKNYSEHVDKLVRVTYGNDKLVVSPVGTHNDISGKVDSTNRKIGSNRLSLSVNIIEIPKVNYKYINSIAKINLARLNNITLNTSNIVYYTRNSNGEIDNLVLTDVTNDMYEYGVILSETQMSMTSSTTSYKYILDGNIVTGVTDNTKYNVNIYEPAGIIATNGNIKKIKKLNKLTNIQDITQYDFKCNSKQYVVTSDVVVYKRVNYTDEYLLSNLSDAIDNQNSYNITAYYDKLPENGGKIRALVMR